MNTCNARCTDPSSAEISEEFNTFFTTVGPKLKYNIKHVPLTKMDEVNHSTYLKPITCDEVREITDMDETLLVSLQCKKYRFKLATVYNPPRTNKRKIVEKLDKFLNDLTSINCSTVITGEFNIDTHVENQLHSNYL